MYTVVPFQMNTIVTGCHQISSPVEHVVKLGGLCLYYLQWKCTYHRSALFSSCVDVSIFRHNHFSRLTTSGIAVFSDYVHTISQETSTAMDKSAPQSNKETYTGTGASDDTGDRKQRPCDACYVDTCFCSLLSRIHLFLNELDTFIHIMCVYSIDC